MPPEDPALGHWFLTEAERGNPATELRPFTIGNLVEPLVHGRAYFAALHRALRLLGRGDEVYFASFRIDGQELLDGPGTGVTEVLQGVRRRGASVYGLVWRSQPEELEQSERANSEVVRDLREVDAEVLLDARTRRGGSHHQKLVVCRGKDNVAFVGGIDLALSRADDAPHHGDPQAMPFTEAYGRRPPWHDVQVAIRGPAVTDLELTFRERWKGSSVVDIPSPVRMLLDRVKHAGAATTAELPDQRPDPPEAGPHAVQVLRTYPARWRRYPFAPLGERSIAHAYKKSLRLSLIHI